MGGSPKVKFATSRCCSVPRVPINALEFQVPSAIGTRSTRHDRHIAPCFGPKREVVLTGTTIATTNLCPLTRPYHHDSHRYSFTALPLLSSCKRIFCSSPTCRFHPGNDSRVSTSRYSPVLRDPSRPLTDLHRKPPPPPSCPSQRPAQHP